MFFSDSLRGGPTNRSGLPCFFVVLEIVRDRMRLLWEQDGACSVARTTFLRKAAFSGGFLRFKFDFCNFGVCGFVVA